MKNKFMRIAAVMLMLCLVTTCAISGTFAKYTTSVDGSDTARVAYWGWNKAAAEIKLSELFTTSYDVTAADDAKTVVSVNDDNVIAPGTGNSATFKFQYTPNAAETANAPEVDYTFVVETTGSTTDAANAILTNPNIQWKLSVAGDTGVAYTVPSGNKALNEWGTYAELIANIEALDGNKTDNKYESQTLPAAFDGEEVWTVSWQWIYSTDATQDEADTVMGNQATLAEVTVAIKITATQLD